jgi:hypothetical protein
VRLIGCRGSDGVIVLPLPGQPGHRGPGQSCRRAEELLQCGHEVPGGQSVQVEQRQDLGDLRRLAAPRRQDLRGEPSTLAGGRRPGGRSPAPPRTGPGETFGIHYAEHGRTLPTRPATRAYSVTIRIIREGTPSACPPGTDPQVPSIARCRVATNAWAAHTIRGNAPSFGCLAVALCRVAPRGGRSVHMLRLHPTYAARSSARGESGQCRPRPVGLLLWTTWPGL